MNTRDHFPIGGMEGLDDLEAAFAELVDACRAFPGTLDRERWAMCRVAAKIAINEFLPPADPPKPESPELCRFHAARDAAIAAAIGWMDRDGADLESASETVMAVARRAAGA